MLRQDPDSSIFVSMFLFFPARTRVIFSPFVSPLEGVSMLGMMGCSMTAASQANSMMVEDEDQVQNFVFGQI